MKIVAKCPTCQVTIAVAAENAGKRARCPKCGGVISIPDAAPSQSPPATRRSQPEKLKPQQSPSETSQPRTGASSGSPRGHQSEGASGKSRRNNEVPRERPPGRSKSAPQRRKKEPIAEDLWNEPFSSYSSPAIEEEDYEAYGLPPKRSQNRGEYNPRTGQRNVGTYQSDTEFSYKLPLIMSAIGLGSAIVLGAIGLVFPPAGFAGAVIGGLIGFVLGFWGGLKILGNAFEDSFVTGFLTLMCGPYALYFVFSRWDINKHPFFINLMGTCVYLVSLAVGGLVAAMSAN